MTDSQKWLILIGMLTTGVLLYLLAPVLTPFLIASMLAYLGDPVVDRLERRRVSRTIAVVIVFTGMFVVALVLVLILVPVLERQTVILINKVPDAAEWLHGWLLANALPIAGITELNLDADALRNAIAARWQDLGNALTRVLGGIFQSGQIVLTWLAYLLLIPVVTFYLLRDWDILVSRVRLMIPRRMEPTVTALARDCDSVLAEFMRGQLAVMAALAFIYACGLWLVGLELAFLIGLMAGLVSFVPYLGFVVGIVIAGFAAIMQFHDVIHVVYITVVFGIGQAIEGMLLSPILVGDRIGLHPVAVIFAVMAGGQLFGFFGILIALPMAAVIVVLLRYLHAQYMDSSLYSP